MCRSSGGREACSAAGCAAGHACRGERYGSLVLSDQAPVVARWGGQPLEIGGPENLSTPRIVLLHGSGATENSMVTLAPHLPFGPAYAAVRGGVGAGGGYTWFEPGGLPVAMDRFLNWLDAEGDPDRPVILVGFGDGAALAAALLLTRPERWAGGVLLHGSLPPDVHRIRGRLIGVQVFLATASPDDPVRDHLVHESGAPVWAERDPGGARLTGELVAAVDRWLTARLDHRTASARTRSPTATTRRGRPCWRRPFRSASAARSPVAPPRCSPSLSPTTRWARAGRSRTRWPASPSPPARY